MPKVNFYTDNGITFNEDFVYGTADFGFIIDGATGISSVKMSQGNSDAQVLSHQLGVFLSHHLSDTSRDIRDILRDGVEWVKKEFFANTKKADENRLPSCTFACYRKKGEFLELAWRGDSPIILAAKKTEILYDQDIEHFDGLALSKFKQLLNTGSSFEEASEGIRELLMQNRSKKNQDDGYWIIDLIGDGISHLNLRTIPLNEVQQVLICSDGFYRLQDVFGLVDFQQEAKNYQGYPSLVEAVNKLRMLENQPNSIQDYPRLKVSDDASVLSVIFK